MSTSKAEDDILQCECGSKTFTIARDGLIECSKCKSPTDRLMAKPDDVWTNVLLRRLRSPDDRPPSPF